MNIAMKLLVTGIALALGACGTSTQQDVDKAAHDSAAGVAKAQQAAQPDVDAANREMKKAQQEGNAKVADASAEANRGVDAAAKKQALEKAKADYDVAIATADGNLSVALETCKMGSADAKATCAQDAQLLRDQAANTAKARLDASNEQNG